MKRHAAVFGLIKVVNYAFRSTIVQIINSAYSAHAFARAELRHEHVWRIVLVRAIQFGANPRGCLIFRILFSREVIHGRKILRSDISPALSLLHKRRQAELICWKIGRADVGAAYAFIRGLSNERIIDNQVVATY